MAVYKKKTATKDGRKWYYSVWYEKANGERERKKSHLYATKVEAQEAERQFLTDKTYDRVDITFKEMYYQYMDYLEEGIKETSVISKDSRVENHIMTYFGAMNIHKITVNAVIDWKSKINKATYGKEKKEYALSYKQSLFKELSATLKYGMDFCGLKDNVANKANNFQDKNDKVVTDEEKIRYITPSEYNLFTSVIDNIIHKAFFAFLYYMGVRKGEAQALTWEDIFWDYSKVRIIKTLTNKTRKRNENGVKLKITNTKNRKNRTIQIPEILKDLLIELHQYYSDYEGFNKKWFVFGGYRHLASQTIDNHKDHYFKLAKETYGVAINRITNHEFRHSHASYLISTGVRIELIAYRLGDTVGVVEKIYAHLFPEVEDEIMERLNWVENYKVIEVTKKEFLKSPQATKILQTN